MPRLSWTGALLGLLALAGCAAPAAPPPSPPLSYPPSARERMLHIVRAEWADWGCIASGLPGAALTPCAGTPAVEMGHEESRPENFPRVLAYWRAVPDDEGAIRRNRALYAAAIANPAEPQGIWAEPAWSAAFISYVMRNAGVDEREFPSSAAHSFYIDGMLADAARFPNQASFIPHDPGTYAPVPGDLICADRSRHPLSNWRQRLSETGQFRPMHCDIVTATGPGVIEAIGGNVGDAVTLSRFEADSAGTPLPRGAGRPIWVVTFENRLGRLPPWGNTGS
ncbi:DUF2272 domain-containing protein [Acetobacteraceae bacterium H6797]|nr:DUF2272 domain-containing protein [Acetobacteraceae bacterium H6797]